MPSLNTGNAILSNAITVDGSYNVGIGTASPTSIGTNYKTLDIRGTSGGGVNFGVASSTYAGIYADAAGVNLTTTSSIPILFGSNSSEKMRVTPSGVLQINTTANSTPYTSGTYKLIAKVGTDRNIGIGINSGECSFEAFNDAVNASVMLKIFGLPIYLSSNTGIGTTTPTNVGAYKSLTIDGTDGSIVDLRFNGAGGGRFYTSSDTAAGMESLSTTLPLIFKTQNGSGTQERLRITPAGNVGIGTNAPAEKLEVAGNIKMSGTSNAAFFGGVQASWAGSTNYPTLYGASADRWVMHINPHISYVQNGVNGYTGSTYGAMVRMASDPAANNYWDMGILSVFGGDKWGISRNTSGLASLTSAGVWSTNGGGTSDARVKQNIEYIEGNGLDAIQVLKPVKFEFIDNPEKTRRGFIAQDVLEVIPDLVLGDGEREGGTYGLDYDGILALAVKAIQELNQTIQNQQQQINQLINK